MSLLGQGRETPFQLLTTILEVVENSIRNLEDKNAVSYDVQNTC